LPTTTQNKIVEWEDAKIACTVACPEGEVSFACKCRRSTQEACATVTCAVTATPGAAPAPEPEQEAPPSAEGQGPLEGSAQTQASKMPEPAKPTNPTSQPTLTAPPKTGSVRMCCRTESSGRPLVVRARGAEPSRNIYVYFIYITGARIR
jgi:hypothetical protein